MCFWEKRMFCEISAEHLFKLYVTLWGKSVCVCVTRDSREFLIKSFRTTSVTVRENLVDGMLECVGEHKDNNRLRYLLLSSSRVASLKEAYQNTCNSCF